MPTTINTRVGSEKTKIFFETHTTKEGIRYLAAHNGIEISGLVKTKSKAVVERIVSRSLNTPKEVPPNVVTAIDKITDYVVSTIDQFGSDYVSVSVAVKAGEAKMNLTVYLTLYSDDKVTEWRGGAEAAVEWHKGWHLVKRRVVFKDDISSFELYRQLADVARHAYAVVED